MRQFFFFQLPLLIFFIFLFQLRRQPILLQKQLVDPQEPKQASSTLQPLLTQLEQLTLQNEPISEQPTFQHF